MLEISPVRAPAPAIMATARVPGGGRGRVSAFRKSHFIPDSGQFQPRSAPLSGRSRRRYGARGLPPERRQSGGGSIRHYT